MDVNCKRMLLLTSIVVLALAAAMPSAAAARSFSDVGEDAWFNEAVDVLSNRGVARGSSDGSYRPYETVTRAQFAALLARAVHPPAAGQEPFTDVPATAWYRDSVAALHAAGLVKGTSATLFSPFGNISRQQAASLVMRATAYARGDEQSTLGSFSVATEHAKMWLRGFRDRNSIAAAHEQAVGSAVRLQVLQGKGDGRCYPLDTLTRAQAAGVLYRALYLPLSPRSSPPDEVPAEVDYPSLSLGSQGEYVRRLESRLVSLRYRPGPLDGVFDHKTAAAVTAFQKVEGLSRDGHAGTQVWTALGKASLPKLRSTGDDNRVEIDLTRQVLFLAQGGELVKVLPISSGTTGWRTPTGHFRIQRKIPRWRESELGLLYKPAYFIGGIAIHGSYSVPSYAASHGCIRVPLWEMDQLYSELPIGLPVQVYY